MIYTQNMSTPKEIFDLFIIGGGVNGTGIAADAAGRGLSVFLAEQNDLASATSSSSSKLIHGGLRYLEHYEFRLVKEALAEREILLKNAKHIMWPLTFRLPHQPHLRPAWMIRIGLFLYDNLAKRETLRGSRGIKFDHNSPLKTHITKGFEYSDGWVDDSRLVVLNALQAAQKEAQIHTRCKCIKAERTGKFWKVTIQSTIDHSTKEVYTKGIVNAAGPWVSRLFDDIIPTKAPKQIRLVKGSHIIVPRLHDQHQAYILQNQDKRIVFVLPYEQDFSLIGTTDIDYRGDPSEVAIDNDEINYLISISNSHFKTQISKADIVANFSGVRPLIDDQSSQAQAVTRDYTLTLDSENQLPLLSVFGGKITTYRKLAENVVDKLQPFYPQMTAPWTHLIPLPGGKFDCFDSLISQLNKQYPFIDESQLKRYARSYGTYTEVLLEGVASTQQLGKHFGADLYEVEINYLLKTEWAIEAEDILWRRSKLGLKLNEQQVEQLKLYLRSRPEFAAA